MNKPTQKISKETVYQNLLAHLSSENENYPWSPETAEDYYESLDPPSGVKDYLKSAKVKQKSEDFFYQIKKLQPPNRWEKVNQKIYKEFGKSVPPNWLEAIIEQLRKNTNQTTSALEQLINSVQPLFSHWFSEDLAVFARPVAYTMRGAQTLPQKNWTQLSESEQIRLTFTIAKLALDLYEEQKNLE